jgi:hypothetical protein
MVTERKLTNGATGEEIKGGRTAVKGKTHKEEQQKKKGGDKKKEVVKTGQHRLTVY